MSDRPEFSAYPLEDYERHSARISEAIERVLKSGWYILGREVEQFEMEFSTWSDSRYTIGVANGTDAIELLLRAYGIGEGTEVILPSHTAVATGAAVVRCGARPIFADVDAERFTLNPGALPDAMAKATPGRLKAVIAVHLYGQPADLGKLLPLCADAGLLLFEDCAQAHGATWKGRPVGGLADGGAFSFYPTKNLGAIGDGGAITVNDRAIAERIRELRQYGWRRRYISEIPGGINSRLDELQAAILRVKLRSLPDQIQNRRRLAANYRKELANVPELHLPPAINDTGHAFHLYVIRTAQRDALIKHLQNEGIPVALHYPAAIHQQPAFREAAAASPLLSDTERLIREIITLPLHAHLSEPAVRYTAEAIRKFFGHS